MRVTAREAGMAYQAIRSDAFAQKEQDKNRQVAELIKVLISRGHSIKTAAPIAKRAYRMGVK